MIAATLLALVALAFANLNSPPSSSGVPSLKVPACPSKATASWDKAMPTPTAFPRTHVDLCYDSTDIHLTFNALDEVHYFYNSSYQTNDNIYEYEVMEAFLYHGTNDPTTYMEFEIAPNNVTFNAWIYNPSKVRTSGYPFNGAYITHAIEDGIVGQTTLDRSKHTWVSDVKIPLAHFSVDQPKGSKWRMNFFRTVVDPKTFPNQTLGAWSPNGQPNFHNSFRFGHVEFV